MNIIMRLELLYLIVLKLQTNNFSNRFNNMKNLVSCEFPYEKANSMFMTFAGCSNFKDDPVCGDNVTHLGYAYYGCKNITGHAVCGPNVTDMSRAYEYCTKLTTAVCGPNVTDMAYAYSGCTRLYTAVCGDKVTDMYQAYYNSVNIRGNAYFYSNNVNSASECFYNRKRSSMLNIYTHINSITLNTLLIETTSITNSYLTLTSNVITWTNDSVNNRYYNTFENIYIYPVSNVDAVRAANGD